jgi:hypothetical protein
MKIVMLASRGHRSTFALQGVALMSKRLLVAIALAVAGSPSLAADDFIPHVSLEDGAIGVDGAASWTRKHVPYAKPGAASDDDDTALYFVASSADSQAVGEMLSWRWRMQGRFTTRRA